MVILCTLIGLVIGAGVIWLISNANKRLSDSKLQQAERELANAMARCSSLEQSNAALSQERGELRESLAAKESQIAATHAQLLALKESNDLQTRELRESNDQQTRELKEATDNQIQQIKEANAQQVQEIKQAADQRIAQIQLENQKLREESDAQWQLRFDKLREEFKSMTANALASKQSALQESNREQMGELLRPIREQFEQFRKAVDESRTSGEVAKKELKSTFESTMKLFEQQQRMTVEELRRETSRIGEDAANLTRALKRDTKTQGDWGEMILDTLLESSGLERDVHYFIQDNVKDEEGNNRRPDVVVRFPEGRAVVIDSKVSLTSYVEAFETNDESTRMKKLREHARSVRKHIDELADKKYDELVDDSISFVLMFIPNDQCYLTAMEQDPTLGSYAYARGIVIISPSNLLIALQLSYNMWQKQRQEENIQDIVREATAIYEKAANFTETFLRTEAQLATVVKSFAQARGQLYDGAGNFLRRLEALKAKGITPKKSIKGLKNKASSTPAETELLEEPQIDDTPANPEHQIDDTTANLEQ